MAKKKAVTRKTNKKAAPRKAKATAIRPTVKATPAKRGRPRKDAVVAPAASHLAATSVNEAVQAMAAGVRKLSKQISELNLDLVELSGIVDALKTIAKDVHASASGALAPVTPAQQVVDTVKSNNQPTLVHAQEF